MGKDDSVRLTLLIEAGDDRFALNLSFDDPNRQLLIGEKKFRIGNMMLFVSLEKMEVL